LKYIDYFNFQEAYGNVPAGARYLMMMMMMMMIRLLSAVFEI